MLMAEHDDNIATGAANDTIQGGDGNDTINGGAGTDFLRGGNGNDQFVFTALDSGTTAGSLDQIQDWQSTDKLSLGFGVGSLSNYAEALTAAPDYATALSSATNFFATGSTAFTYFAVQIGGDVVVFVDNAGSTGPTDAIVLVGRTLADIDQTNFV